MKIIDLLLIFTSIIIMMIGYIFSFGNKKTYNMQMAILVFVMFTVYSIGFISIYNDFNSVKNGK